MSNRKNVLPLPPGVNVSMSPVGTSFVAGAVIAFDKVLTDDERQKVSNWLIDRWGTPMEKSLADWLEAYNDTTTGWWPLPQSYLAALFVMSLRSHARGRGRYIGGHPGQVRQSPALIDISIADLAAIVFMCEDDPEKLAALEALLRVVPAPMVAWPTSSSKPPLSIDTAVALVPVLQWLREVLPRYEFGSRVQEGTKP